MKGIGISGDSAEKLPPSSTYRLYRLHKSVTSYIVPGSIYVNKKPMNAHRVIYEALVGDIPDGMEVDHLCEIKLCINPDHLEPVTHKENTARHYRRFYGTVCRNGHVRTSANTKVYRVSKANLSANENRTRISCLDCDREIKIRQGASNRLSVELEGRVTVKYEMCPMCNGMTGQLKRHLRTRHGVVYSKDSLSMLAPPAERAAGEKK